MRLPTNGIKRYTLLSASLLRPGRFFNLNSPKNLQLRIQKTVFNMTDLPLHFQTPSPSYLWFFQKRRILNGSPRKLSVLRANAYEICCTLVLHSPLLISYCDRQLMAACPAGTPRVTAHQNQICSYSVESLQEQQA